MIVRLSVCLLLLATRAAGASPGPAVRSGDVALTLSSAQASYLPIDLEAAAEEICQGRVPRFVPTALGECRLKVVIPTGVDGPPFSLALADGSWLATGLALAADAPVASSCGPWSATVVLDAALPQPPAALALSTAGGESARGAFASALAVHANLHLVNLERGQIVDLPLTLGFDMAGSWAQASRAEEEDLPEAASDLIFFADREEGALVNRTDCVAVRVLAGCLQNAFSDNLVDCPLCFQPKSFARPGFFQGD